jgi:hypothetical protein
LPDVPALTDRAAVLSYVREQAAQGLEHVRALVKAEGDAILAALAELTEEEGNFKPGPDEFSALQVLQHLNGSLPRSIDRLRTLSSGRPWSAPPGGGPAGPGSIPENATSSFMEARRQFATGLEEVLTVLQAADPSRGLELTTPHAAYGDFNWLQRAVYSHHVHTHDHVGQLQELRAMLRKP